MNRDQKSLLQPPVEALGGLPADAPAQMRRYPVPCLIGRPNVDPADHHAKRSAVAVDAERARLPAVRTLEAYGHAVRLPQGGARHLDREAPEVIVAKQPRGDLNAVGTDQNTLFRQRRAGDETADLQDDADRRFRAARQAQNDAGFGAKTPSAGRLRTIKSDELGGVVGRQTIDALPWTWEAKS